MTVLSDKWDSQYMEILIVGSEDRPFINKVDENDVLSEYVQWIK